MKRRDWLALGCAHCVGLAAAWPRGAFAQDAAAASTTTAWTPPARFTRPELSSEEGGLWAMMDREEVRLRRSPFVMRDKTLRDYLQGIACKLGGEHCADVRVYPVRTALYNASMAPNGMMQVWSGLMLRAENEAQLAAVLGYEIGHYLQRHVLDRMRDVRDRAAFATFMVPFGVVGLVGQLAAAAGMYGFTRDQERDADRIGLALMRSAGYDPREASKTWDNLLAERSASQGDDAKATPIFATHPGAEERARTLADMAADATGGFVGEAEYAAKLAPFMFDLLDDELKRGQHAETLVLLERMLGRAPGRPDLLYFRGETRRLRAAGDDLDLALEDFRSAAAADGAPAQVFRSAGYIHRQREQWPEARAAFERYVELAPAAPDVNMIKSMITGEKT